MSSQTLPAESIDQAILDNQYDYAEKYISLSGLPRVKADILRVEMQQYMSESPSMSAKQIAKSLDCSVESIYKAHKDARYIAAKDKILDIWFAGQAGSVYKAVISTAIDGKVGAQRLYLESVGKTSKRIETHNVNLNADILSDQTTDLDGAIDRFLIMIGSRGWSLDMLADKWRQLKNQQAF